MDYNKPRSFANLDKPLKNMFADLMNRRQYDIPLMAEALADDTSYEEDFPFSTSRIPEYISDFEGDDPSHIDTFFSDGMTIPESSLAKYANRPDLLYQYYVSIDDENKGYSGYNKEYPEYIDNPFYKAVRAGTHAVQNEINNPEAYAMNPMNDTATQNLLNESIDFDDETLDNIDDFSPENADFDVGEDYGDTILTRNLLREFFKRNYKK